MNEVTHISHPLCWWWEGSESGLAGMVLNSQDSQVLTSSEEGAFYSQVSVVIFRCVSRYSTCFVLCNYKFMTMFLW
jgi:hypothetical protein